MINSRCGNFSARKLSISIEAVSGELFDAEGKMLKAFYVKRNGNRFKVSVGRSNLNAKFDITINGK